MTKHETISVPPVLEGSASEVEALREQVRRMSADLQELRDHLPEAFIEVDIPAFRLRYMNQVAMSVLGYGPEDVEAGLNAYALLDEASTIQVVEIATKQLADSLWAGKPYERERGQRTFQMTMVRKNGTSFPADVLGSYMLDDERNPIGVRYIFRDTTERQLAEAERSRLAALVEWSDDAIISRGLDGKVLSWNSGAERMYGYTAAEMIGQELDLVEGPGVKGQLRGFLPNQAAGERHVIETQRVARDGREFDVSVSLFPVKDSRGELVAVGGIGRDISERIAWADTLRRSNDMLAALSSAQTQFIRSRQPQEVFEGLLESLLKVTASEYGFIGEVLHDAEGNPYLKTHAITNISWDAATRAFYDAEIGNGLEFRNLQTLFGRVLATAEPLIANDAPNDPRRGGLPNGHPGLKSFMGLPIKVGGRLVGMIGVSNKADGYQDSMVEFMAPFLTTCGTIIEALNLERARRAAEERLDMAMRGSDLALWEWDVRNGTLSAQFPANGNHGYSFADGQTTLEFLMEQVHPEDRERVVGSFIAHARGKTPAVECEHRVLNGRGEYRWMLTRGTVIARNAEGHPLRGAGTFLDITDRKLAQDERERLEQQVRQSQKLESMGVFAGGIAHDFNNLLTAILGNLYLLEQEVRGTQAELVLEARGAAERGAELVSRLLTYARPEVERSEIVRLDRLVSETATLARSVLTPKVRLVINRDPGSPRTRGSWTSLQQVLLNLLVNARDAMPDGGTLTLGRRTVSVGPRHRWAPPELPRGRYHLVTVTDTGEGMSPAVVERIFDPFFTTKDVGRGTGLGLSTALGIARAHGGWLAVDSTPGQGSTFRLLLPLADDSSNDL